MVAALVLETSPVRGVGSSPTLPTKYASLVFNGLASLASTQRVSVRIRHDAPNSSRLDEMIDDIYKSLLCL